MTLVEESGATIIVDLGFGDAGKGLATDYFARALAAKRVFRFNGGAQAGHNVVLPGGTHHTFSQFAAASFLPDVETVLLDHVVLHPTALLQEARVLERKGVRDPLSRIFIEPGAMVTTPFHQAAGRLRERLRPKRHGSCGVGFGETVRDALAHEPLRFRDLADTNLFRKKAMSAQERLRTEILETFGRASTRDLEFLFLDDPSIVETWIEHCEEMRGRVRTYDRSMQSRVDPIVFEGAQGVLIDEVHGFAPHTTWSNCTFQNAERFLVDIGYARPTSRVGVIRSYAVRHGEGPLPSEHRDTDLGIRLRAREKHNVTGPWQGRVRVGPFDLPLFQYAIECTGRLSVLLVTHLDAFEHEIPVAMGDQERPWAPREREEKVERDALLEMLKKEAGAISVCASYGPTHLDVGDAEG